MSYCLCYSEIRFRDCHGKRMRKTGIRNEILTLDRPNDKQNRLPLSVSNRLLWRQTNALNTLLKQGSGKISSLIYKQHSPYKSLRYTRQHVIFGHSIFFRRTFQTDSWTCDFHCSFFWVVLMDGPYPVTIFYSRVSKQHRNFTGLPALGSFIRLSLMSSQRTVFSYTVGGMHRFTVLWYSHAMIRLQYSMESSYTHYLRFI